MCPIYCRCWHSDWLTISCEKIDKLQKTEDMKETALVITIYSFWT